MQIFPDAAHDPVWLLRLPQRFAVAAPTVVALVLASIAVKFALNLIEPKVLLFSTYYPSIAASALMFGRRWGYIAIILSFGSAQYLFVEPLYHLLPISALAIVNCIAFVAAGAMLVEICVAYRRTLKRLQRKREIIAEDHARIELMARELQHRSKNSAAILSAIVRQTLSETPSKADAILGRMRALHAVDLLETNLRGRVSLRDLVESGVSLIERDALLLKGPDMTVTAGIARSLALILHELSTNATKYGALVHPNGKVRIEWSSNEQVLMMLWEEHGGVPLTPGPIRRGFGSLLIDRLLQDCGGTIKRAFLTSGLRCEISIPALTSAELPND